MTKYSARAKDRRFDWNEENGVHRRAVKKTAVERQNIGDCPLCGIPVYVSPGQLVTRIKDRFGEWHPTHKSCRKEKGL